MKIIIINGPNLNNLGKREKDQYGSYSLEDINKRIKEEFPSIEFDFFQSNVEGEIINRIQSASGKFDAIVINPGGYAHTSVAIRDALQDLNMVKVEVHLSNLAAREEFRHTSLTASVCNGYISGFKELSYISAIFLITKLLERK
jgi:3-dehydroquinate dehydratase-2